MNALHLVLLVGSLVCFGLAATSYGKDSWNKLVALGLALLVATMITW